MLSCCELLSFFVPLGWFTATVVCYISRCVLWIAFVLCTFGLIYSVLTVNNVTTSVVNCFRSLYLWVDLQPLRKFLKLLRSCELLSFFVPLGWFTAIVVYECSQNQLWIAFVLCTFGLIYSRTSGSFLSQSVVNCFRSLYLWVDLQPVVKITPPLVVVNCFRSLYLWVDLQRCALLIFNKLCCELLSFFVPLGWFTAFRKIISYGKRCELLSFFVPLGWFTAIIRKELTTKCCELLSFFVPLGWFTAYLGISWRPPCCELLSFFVPLGWFTARATKSLNLA